MTPIQYAERYANSSSCTGSFNLPSNPIIIIIIPILQVRKLMFRKVEHGPSAQQF